MILLVSDPKLYAAQKVVSAEEVEPLSRNGWRVLAIVEEATVVRCREPMSDASMEASKRAGFFPMSSFDSRGNQCGPTQEREAIGTVARYVMGLDETSALAEAEKRAHLATERADMLRREANEIARSIGAAKDKAAETEKALATLQLAADTLEKAVERERSRANAAELRLRSIELDLGKVRKEVGEARWRELTAPPEKDRS